MTNFEKETRHGLYVFIKKKKQTNKQKKTTTLSNYKHDSYTVLLVLKLGW